jgi:hypothetical protein
MKAGQAIVGNVEGGGMRTKSENQPHALGMHRAQRCGAKTRCGKPCQSPAMPNGRCRMHGGPSPGAPKGNRHAYMHGRYSAESITLRQKISALVQLARTLNSKVIRRKPRKPSRGGPTVDAECTVGHLRGHRREIGMHSSTVVILRKRFCIGGSYRQCSVQ